MSDPLRQLFEAPTVADIGRLLREHPSAIARAIGVESLPALTVSLMAMAALGPVGGAVALTGTSGLDGYAKGLIGALARAGVDVSNAEDLYRALQNAALMERVRKDATTDGAVDAEYVAERIAKKRANAAFRRKQGLVGQPVDVHELQPVKFGGSPTDPANKVVLSRDVHRQQVTPWWNKLLKT